MIIRTTQSHKPTGCVGAALLVATFLSTALMAGPSTAAGLDGRERDPVVLTGAEVPALSGIEPESLTAYRRDSGGWKQVPVQVDERHDVNLRNLYPFTGGFVQGGAVVVNAYSDAGTLAGADPDSGIDADDEIALMASDAGRRVPASYGGIPAGMEATGASEVKVSDPGGGAAYFYLFEAKVRVDQGAGLDYVDYDFNLLSGDYLSNYDFADGPNPETSRVETDFYSAGLSDRWINDELRLKAPGASGVDILDREKAQFLPGVCGRSTKTFAAAEGSFVVNRDGPVRAIRSFIGANSGPYTQREHVFYRGQSQTRTFLRVHAIPGVMQFTDYSPEASGMTYRNALNKGGVTIDGQPDSVVPGLPPEVIDGMPFWEQVSGPQGSLDVITELDTDMAGLGITSYYLDDSSPDEPDEVQCTGDAAAYGSSGTWITTGIPNTDPRQAGYGNLTATKTVYYEGPDATVSRAEARRDSVENPLVPTSSPLGPPLDPAKLRASLNAKRLKLSSRRKAVLRVRLRNAGGSASGRIKVCARVRARGVRLAGKRRCRNLTALAAGRKASLRFGVRSRRSARPGSRAKVVIKVFERGSRIDRMVARVRVR